jgi:menaquinone-dependent protoporphyrinogen oxidase
MNILVTYGSKMGGTEGLAEMIGHALEDAGIDVVVSPASDVASLAGYDAVIVGGGLYAGRWHKQARRFVKRHQKTLRTMPVWLFSSGPLDDSALTEDIPPVRQVASAGDLVGARGHATFGGRLSPDAAWFPASSMAKTMAGDWRDRTQVRDWSNQIAEELGATTSHSVGGDRF